MLHHLTFSLQPVPPFRLDLTVWVLRRRPDNAVDRWDGQTWRRVLVLEGGPVELAVIQTHPPEMPRLKITVTGPSLGPATKSVVTAALQRLLGTPIDLREFYRLAAQHPRLGELVESFRGAKPPQFPTLFETLVNAIACQQVTLTLGIRLLNRLSTAYGLVVQEDATPAHAFPRPEDLAALVPEALRALGFSRQKARALIELAQAIAEQRFDPEGFASLTDEVAVSRLSERRGVGRWTAEYVLLRGLGRLHIFPGDDVGARNHLQRWLGMAEPLDYEGVRRTLADWQGFGGLIYFHLLLKGLAERGHLVNFGGG